MKLVPFGPTGVPGEIDADLSFDRKGKLVLEFRWDTRWKLKGIPDREVYPSVRADELWKSTCFEAFIQPYEQEQYWEINFSPDGRWNVYHFEEYRQPYPPREAVGWSLIDFALEAAACRAVFEPNLKRGIPLLAGVTAVIDWTSGEKSYWALSHSQEKPDFHDSRGFTLERKLK